MTLNLRMTLNAWCMMVGVHSGGVCVMMSLQCLHDVLSLNHLIVTI